MPCGKESTRASLCSVRQTHSRSRVKTSVHTLQNKIVCLSFTTTGWGGGERSCRINLSTLSRLLQNKKIFFQLIVKSPNFFSHSSLRQTGVGMLKSRFKVLAQTWAVLGPAQPRKAGGHVGGLQACRHLTVIALVLYRAPECAQSHGVSV